MTHITIAPEVQQALAQNKPVVALESTLITHGLPYPQNRDTALAMEQAVRDEGAIPATIAILQGKITVGLSQDEVEMLAQMPTGSVRKCSRRDIAIAVGLGETAATTVAGTMIIAHMAGLRIFATGGIGGVHRGHPEDISADLIELGRTPVTVVSSGAKSILDIPRTLEVLETQGVPIIGYGTDSLPLFFTRKSNYAIDVRVDGAEDVAKIMQASDNLDVQNGMLITVPVPEEEALPEAEAEKAIQQATEEAEAQGIHGKEVTPFVLGRVVALTEGSSMRANHALLVNNARTAAQIARAYQGLLGN
jgi:pseudouridine-5'-phosphate glycosidase